MTETLISTTPISLSSLFDRVEALFKQAEIALGKDKISLAEYFFHAAHSKDPENIELVFNEAKLWHHYGKQLVSAPFFHKGYRLYKQCFHNESIHEKALMGCLNLKIDEFHVTDNIGAINDACRLLRRKDVNSLASQDLEIIKAKVLFYKGCYYKDTQELLKALTHLEDTSAIMLDLKADIYLKLHELTQDMSHMLKALMLRKQALELDVDNIQLYMNLAHVYDKIFYVTLNEYNIENRPINNMVRYDEFVW